MSECIRCFVSGRVQGVFFRASAREEARRLGISGYAKNLADGRVEVLACGEPDRLSRFREWLREGPPHATVTDLNYETVKADPPQGFSVS